MKWNNTVLNEINANYYCFKCKKELKTALHWYIGQTKVYFLESKVNCFDA